MAPVTTGINHRWVTSSGCLGGNSHVNCASSSAPCPCIRSALEDPQKHVLAKAFVALTSRGGVTTERNPSHHPRSLTDAQIYEPLVSLIDPQRVQTNTCWEQES